MKHLKILIASAGLCIACTALSDQGAEASLNQDPVLSKYLDCINSETKKQSDTNGSKQIDDPQAIIDSCKEAKTALLSSANGEQWGKIVTRLEQHLRERDPKSK